LNNIRIIRHDIIEVLQYMLPQQGLDGVHIFFPDPWPKKRHHKRRLIQQHLIYLLLPLLKPGAYIHLATDWEAYADHMIEVLSRCPELDFRGQTFLMRPEQRPMTKFEIQGLKLGHGVWDIMVFKKENADAVSADSQ
jgi:tRNA (guanine-N7-)-methyltransferase